LGVGAPVGKTSKSIVSQYDNRSPKVLVLSDEVPQTVNAGAILLYRLFSGYGESDKLKCGDVETLKGFRAGSSAQEAGHNDPRAARLFVIGPMPHPNAELLDCPYQELRMPLRRLETSRFSVHKRSLQALGLVPLPPHRKFMRMLGDFRPDLIVTVMQGTPFMCLAERTAKKLNIPLILIVHDLNEEFEAVFPWAKQALFDVNRRVYRSAARRLCVSPEMVAYLQNRYGEPGEVMYPNRSEALQPRPLEMSLALRAEATAAEKLK